MTVLEKARLIREAMDAAGASLPEDKAIECAWLYMPWAPGKSYTVGDICTYGTNGVGDPQLYRCVQDHTAQADWTPDTVPALYTPIGLNPEGYPVWSQPTGAQDAYNKGDVVDYNGKLVVSNMDGNVWSPDEYPDAWGTYKEE